MSSIKDTILQYSQLYVEQETKRFNVAVSSLISERLCSEKRLPPQICVSLKSVPAKNGWIIMVSTPNGSYHNGSHETGLSTTTLCNILKDSGGQEQEYSSQYGHQFIFSLLPKNI